MAHDHAPTAAELAREAARSTFPHHGLERLLTRVRELPGEERRRLAEALAERYLHGTETEPARSGLLVLMARVGRGPDGLPLAAQRAAYVEGFSLSHCLWGAEGRELLCRAETDEGRPLSAPVIATLRRSALVLGHDTGLVSFAKGFTEPVLNVGEEWAEAALEDGRWRGLLAHAVTARSARPSAAWERTARTLLDGLGAEAVRTAVLGWLALVGRPRTFALRRETHEPDVNASFDPYNANALRGLTWLLALLPPHPATARALGTLVETSLRKAAGLGPRAPKVANAAVGALARTDGEAALAELARLGTRVTYKGTRKLVDAALEARSAALGLSREEIEELAVPGYGLTGTGTAAFPLGEATALLEVRGSRAVLRWRNAAGRQVKAVPAAVRRDHAEALKDLRGLAKDVDTTLSAQAERLDRMFLARRGWTYDRWRAYYLDHPLVGTLARRLIWTVDGTAVAFAEGALRTLAGTPLTGGGTVGLWHPAGRDPAEVVAWREWLERHGVTQPFKQAHREVYLLTDAERRTKRYSNRFAAHVLRQHQFHSLAAVRGWNDTLRLCVDSSAPPAVRELPQWGLRAEFWVEGDGHEYGTDTNDAGTYLRLRTDQVRFYPADAPQNRASTYGGGYTMWPHLGRRVRPLRLDRIPELVLSEVLRDVDLFVGVAGVGNDPTWSDGGPAGRFRTYWHSCAFGELGQSAETRRALLERLVPRLAIADRCTVEGRFLHVRGDLRTYRIHLGSGNVLMSPNDQYLCIVPGGTDTAAGAAPDYLPFEGDRTLAVVLSKAVLLAHDTAITDPAIAGQIRR
ncbi:DUF4132 domain-containing protein [Streptomyces sp. NPDC091027]|uniref:DUF4132 domain-containing protein n=1 Tax=Streptomyces sp. NPDC091027 TaxID=3365971 RepID=UPI00382B937D